MTHTHLPPHREDHPHPAAAQLDRTGDLLKIGWYRAIRFPPLRPLPRTIDANGASIAAQPTVGRRVLTWWFAISIWPLYLLTLGRQIRHVRVLGAASGTFKAINGNGSRDRGRPGLTALATIIGITYLAGVLALELAALLGSAVAAALFALFVIPWAAAVVDQHRKRREDPAGLRRVRSLIGRCADLARSTRPGYVLTEFVSAPDDTGAGVALIESLKREWATTGAVIVLYAATDDLVGYYRRLGAVQDIPGDRRMVFDLRA